MGLLDNFEDRLDKLVNGTFATAFRDVVEPVELASRIQKEMDTRAAIVSRGRTVVPNIFTVDLSTDDISRLDVFAEQMCSELSDVARLYATDQRYTFLGAVEVRFLEDPSLKTGVFKVRSQVHGDSGASMQSPSKPIVAHDATGHPRLEIGPASYPLTKSHTRIGRGANVDIPLDDTGVSRAHADIVLGLPVVVRDLASTNGTLVDGRRISEAPLHDGAQIQIGSTTITYRDA